MQSGQVSRAKTHAKYLPAADQTWLRLWLELFKHPERLSSRWSWQSKQPPSTEILHHIVRRLISFDPDKAYHFLQDHRSQLEAHDYASWYHYLSIRAAKQQHPSALQWLANIPLKERNGEVFEWMVRLQLHQKRWFDALQTMYLMPSDLKASSRWQFWRAYCLRKSGQLSAANVMMRQLAAGHDYYAFLAAQTMHMPINIDGQPSSSNPAIRQKLADNIHAQRAYEWFMLGDLLHASQEWNILLDDAPESVWLAAADLATSWGWHFQTIRAAWLGGAKDDIQMRFPLSYMEVIRHHARELAIPAHWVLAIIRQESAFNPNARSPVGALGLMQLMPKTGREMARHHGLHLKSVADLRKPETNILLGTRYLKELSGRFDGQLALTAAAYNAGPHRVQRWLSGKMPEDPVIWVENIPYEETRTYVQHVLSYAKIYASRLQQHDHLLSQLNLQTAP